MNLICSEFTPGISPIDFLSKPSWLQYPGAGVKPPKTGGVLPYGLSPIAPGQLGYGGKPPKPYGALGALGYRGGVGRKRK
ncbi:UNVERIFIED_CONTAM: hypothetical protein K2H54_035591 [Gekko kuhli]